MLLLIISLKRRVTPINPPPLPRIRPWGKKDMARQVTIRVLFVDTLPFVNESVWSKVRSNCTVFLTFSREQGRISKKWQIRVTLSRTV